MANRILVLPLLVAIWLVGREQWWVDRGQGVAGAEMARPRQDMEGPYQFNLVKK